MSKLILAKCCQRPEIRQSRPYFDGHYGFGAECLTCGQAAVGYDEPQLTGYWEKAGYLDKGQPRTDGEAVTRDLMRLSELLGEAAQIVANIAGVPR